MAKAVLTEFNLARAEKLLCMMALVAAPSVDGAAKLLGVTDRQMRRLIFKYALPLKKGVLLEGQDDVLGGA